MELNDILKLIEAVSQHELTSFVYEENGTKLSMKKQKEMVPVYSAPAVNVSQGQEYGYYNGPASAAMHEPMAGWPAGADAESSVGAEQISSDKVIISPLVGTFYSAPSPEADQFVQVGDTVKKGQVLGIIEAMKLMNEIESEYDGVVEAILVNDEDVVEYGQPLFRIR